MALRRLWREAKLSRLRLLHPSPEGGGWPPSGAKRREGGRVGGATARLDGGRVERMIRLRFPGRRIGHAHGGGDDAAGIGKLCDEHATRVGANRCTANGRESCFAGQVRGRQGRVRRNAEYVGLHGAARLPVDAGQPGGRLLSGGGAGGKADGPVSRPLRSCVGWVEFFTRPNNRIHEPCWVSRSARPNLRL